MNIHSVQRTKLPPRRSRESGRLKSIKIKKRSSLRPLATITQLLKIKTRWLFRKRNLLFQAALREVVEVPGIAVNTKMR